ncbi:gamma-glutamyl kinase [Bacillus coahuilensis p1.1.43]|uniref:Glutamate 5-kinase n=1 Tax=Bacillus coahuilensis p1.1.43 TaxID=1150625 RepID=A0A147K9D7_9BACI|nr:glutamate 5-kinase [Bacillus coahuilensis]KUP06899.1 gamma-glutamyl kinase [Bacillus coahuilensis p1.1.43]
MSSGAQNYRVVIKIGSSSLTSVHGEISRKKLERLVDEIVQLKDDGHEVLLVSSGAVAAGYRKLGCLTRPDSLPEKQAAASIGQGLLIESYSDLFLSHGYVASQILITRSDFLDEHRYNNARNTINVLLERGIIPIVNENDTITIDRLNFGDNDTLSAKVAGLVDADKLIILSDIEGLYDSDPRKNKNATLVERVTEITQEIEAAAGDPGSAVGTGGMKSKINAFKIAMASGIHSFLGKASTPNIIYDAVYHKAVGTYFEYSSNMISLNQKKKWLAFNSGPEGEVVVSKSGKDVMVEEMKDITQTQILQVKGQFSKGVVVRIRDEQGFEIGLGIINYSSEELGIMKEHESENELSVINKDDFVCHLDIKIPVGV